MKSAIAASDGHAPPHRGFVLPARTKSLRALVISIGLIWSVLFVVIGVGYSLQLYADGSIFSYAVAVRDSWAFHWHNIAGRLFVYLATCLPAEAYVGLTGDAAGGIVIYGLLFFSAPLFSLAATYLADRSPDRLIFVVACASTAVLCPLVFGFPTEMWFAHAVFWPALAVAHRRPRTSGGAIAFAALLTALVLTHGGGVVLAFVILGAILARGLNAPELPRSAVGFVIAAVVWVSVHLAFRPDDYIAAVLFDAAFNFIDPRNLATPATGVIALALIGFATVSRTVRWIGIRRHILIAFLIVSGVLLFYWMALDESVLAESRYFLRTALMAFTPVLGAIAVIRSLHLEQRLALPLPISSVSRLVAARGPSPGSVGACLILVMLIHGVETAKFIDAWISYRSAVQELAVGDGIDKSSSGEKFLSSERIPSHLSPLSWSSTTQYLSIVATPGFAPRRLVVDPQSNYYWLPCHRARKSYEATVPVPAETRRLVMVYACSHR
jgi:hypothetical protein